LTRYPVFTLASISAIGCMLAIAALVTGFVWPAVLLFAATVLVLCLLIAIWTGRAAK
jgi:hypothetical protein